MSKTRLKPIADEKDKYNFLAKIRDPREVQILREAAAGLGYPSNHTLLFLLSQHWLNTTNGDIIS